MGRDHGGTHGWAPFATFLNDLDDDLREAVCQIEAVLRAHDKLDRETLKRETNSLHWGPGGFGRAIEEAERAGVVRRIGRKRYALTSEARNAG